MIKEINSESGIFYLDEAMYDLSRKFDPSLYQDCFATLGDAADEMVLGRFMEIAKRVGLFVGITMDSYHKLPRSIGLILEDNEMDKFVHDDYVRREYSKGNIIYFPTEKLVKTMIKGIKPVGRENIFKEIKKAFGLDKEE